MARGPKPPACASCGISTTLIDGREAYPYRPDFVAKWFYRCENCGGKVGCHPNSKRPLGRPACPKVAHARQRVHARLDPIWQSAETAGYDVNDGLEVHRIRQTARSRVYRFLAERLGMTKEECHVGMFDLEQCRLAYLALARVDYRQVRTWAKARKAPSIAVLDRCREASVAFGGPPCWQHAPDPKKFDPCDECKEIPPMTRAKFRKLYSEFRNGRRQNPDKLAGFVLDTGRITFEQMPYKETRISRTHAPLYTTAWFLGAVSGRHKFDGLRQFNARQLKAKQRIPLP